MTVDKLNIKSIAVIGGGPGGLASIYEFLHTTSEGESTVGGKEPELDKRAFTKIVGFEQKDQIGGTWATSIDKPDELPEDLLKESYYDADKIHPSIAVPGGLNETNNYSNPLVTKTASSDDQWRRSGVYPGLYSNVPKRFLRFSSIPYTSDSQDKKDHIDPLVRYQDITKILKDFAEKNKLLDHIRLNSQVQKIEKDTDGKWVLTIRETSKGEDHWYIEKFDAIVIASGHYSVPYIPYIPGLETRSSDSIIHSKSFRNTEPFKDSNVLVVGSSLSGIDIVQYIHPVAKSITISRTPNKDEIFPWIKKAAESYPNKPKITKIDQKTVFFEDGTHLENIDKIIFATGYHWHYPYLDNKFVQLTKPGHGSTPTGGSRVKGLFWDTFNIEDPTIGYVGITLMSLKFHTSETSAAALAGVWSNSSRLPSKEEQYQWEKERLDATLDSYIFHYYPYDVAEDQYVLKLWNYVPKNRPYVLENENFDDFEEALLVSEKAFYDIREGKYT